ncbi:MAG: Uma2 family endonuclease [Acidobacteriota bacterium]|nr:Uma2 family endonuclease [Acidobacteriota bacterium]
MNTQILSEPRKLPKKILIPPLENGDRLTREEFHRRYEAMPENVKAELIKGVVYMSSPVRVKKHGKPHGRIMSFLGIYQFSTKSIDLLDNVTYIANEKYEPQPDAVLRIEENYGGKSWVNDRDYLEGAPELVVEIASSSVSYDLHDKLEIYEQKGVQEYIVWRVLDNQIDWFGLEKGKYKKFVSDKQGIIESKVFPGLRLNVKAMLKDDLQKVLADLQKGLASSNYKSFVKQLSK